MANKLFFLSLTSSVSLFSSQSANSQNQKELTPSDRVRNVAKQALTFLSHPELWTAVGSVTLGAGLLLASRKVITLSHGILFIVSHFFSLKKKELEITTLEQNKNAFAETAKTFKAVANSEITRLKNHANKQEGLSAEEYQKVIEGSPSGINNSSIISQVQELKNLGIISSSLSSSIRMSITTSNVRFPIDPAQPSSDRYRQISCLVALETLEHTVAYVDLISEILTLLSQNGTASLENFRNETSFKRALIFLSQPEPWAAISYVGLPIGVVIASSPIVLGALTIFIISRLFFLHKENLIDNALSSTKTLFAFKFESIRLNTFILRLKSSLNSAPDVSAVQERIQNAIPLDLINRGADTPFSALVKTMREKLEGCSKQPHDLLNSNQPNAKPIRVLDVAHRAIATTLLDLENSARDSFLQLSEAFPMHPILRS